MLNRMKVFADDSVEAMAKITRELGGDARIYSTRQVNGGIEIIAGPPDAEQDEIERPKRFTPARNARKEEDLPPCSPARAQPHAEKIAEHVPAAR